MHYFKCTLFEEALIKVLLYFYYCTLYSYFCSHSCNKIYITQFVCLFMCLFVHFLNPLPVVQGRHQGYICKAYDQGRKIKLFWIRLEQENKFQTQHHMNRKYLFVCHTELPSYPNSNQTSYSFSNVFFLSQFYFHECPNFMPLLYPEGKQGAP